MPRISPFMVIRMAERPLLRLSRTLGAEKLPNFIGSSFVGIGSYIGDAGVEPADIPYAEFQGDNPEALDVAICFPLAVPLSGRGDIEAAVEPAGYRVLFFYQGGYEQIQAVYGEMAEWLSVNGGEQSGPVQEYYCNGPDIEEAKRLTKVALPVIKRRKM